MEPKILSLRMNPGPGQYTDTIMKLPQTMKSSQKIIIGTSKREGSSFYDGQQTKNPGPSDYKMPEYFGMNKRTMAVMKSFSHKIDSKLETPGVGAYNIGQSVNLT